MKLQTLQLEVSTNQIEFNLTGLRSYPSGSLDLADKFAKQFDDLEYADGDQRLTLLQQNVDGLVPAEFATWYRDWSNVEEDSFLCIHTTSPVLSSLPWTELIVRPDVPPTRSGIVRVCNLTGSSPPPAPAEFADVLLSGWAELTAGSPMLGIQRELQQFREKLHSERFKSRVLVDPPRSEFLQACQSSHASIVHISPPSLIRDNSSLAIPVTPDADKRQPDASTYEEVNLDTIVEALRHNERLRLMVMNACGSGLVGCERISRDLDVVALGWPALVRDDTAADFTFYFYARLLEGFTPATAVRSFARVVWTRQALQEFPVLWYPSPEWVNWVPLKELQAPPAQTAEPLPIPSRTQKLGRSTQSKDGVATTLSPSRPPSIHLEFRPRPAINPALLVNGLQPIEHLSIETSEEITVHLCIVCDTGGGLSAYRQTVPLKRGTNPVRVEEIHFPALHELIDRHANRRRVSFTATIFDLNKNELFGETKAAIWMGATEWLDQEETWAFVPAFVNPFNEGVLKIFEEATKVLRTLGKPSDVFSGYANRSTSAVATQIRAIYQTIRDYGNGISYISPPGSPLFDGTSKRSVGQVVRTHSEVVGHRLGTCHDLALLLGACAEYVGIRPLIALLPGHTLFAYWTAGNYQDDYWKTEINKLRTGKEGQDWTIMNSSRLISLIEEGKIVVMEATTVCERNRTFEDACTSGLERLKNDGMDVAIDIYAARRRVQPV